MKIKIYFITEKKLLNELQNILRHLNYILIMIKLSLLPEKGKLL